MKYILILTLAFGNASGRSGQGGAAVAMQEFDTIEACRGSGEMWKKLTDAEMKRTAYIRDSGFTSYLCVPKGEISYDRIRNNYRNVEIF